MRCRHKGPLQLEEFQWETFSCADAALAWCFTFPDGGHALTFVCSYFLSQSLSWLLPQLPYLWLHLELPSLPLPSDYCCCCSNTNQAQDCLPKAKWLRPQKNAVWILSVLSTSSSSPVGIPRLQKFCLCTPRFPGSTGNILWPRPTSGSFLPVVTFTFMKLKDCSGMWTPVGFFSRNTDSSGCTNLQLGNLQTLAATTVLPTAMICTYASLMYKLLVSYSNAWVHPGACKSLILFFSAICFIYPSEHL